MGCLSHRPLFYSKPLQQKTCGRQFGIRYISFYLLLSRIFTVSFDRLHHFAPVRRILSFLTLHHRLESVGLHLTAPLMRMLMFLFVTSVIKAYIQQNGADCSNGCENRSSYKPGVYAKYTVSLVSAADTTAQRTENRRRHSHSEIHTGNQYRNAKGNIFLF